jgi:nucleotide-binding universal stress UspA family protein
MAGRRPHLSRFTSILVATDFSEGATWALRRAARLPLGPGSVLTLLHVLPQGLPPSLAARSATAAERQLGRLAEEAREAGARESTVGPSVETRIATGTPFVEIIRRARAAGADLVAIGRHGGGGLRDLLIGSTAARVIRHGDMPVLVVGASPAGPYRRPLLAAPLEDTLRQIIDTALAVLPEVPPRLTALHASEMPFEGFMTPLFTSRQMQSYRRDAVGAAREDLRSAIRRLVPAGTHCALRVLPGDPRALVAREASRRRCDLLVVGTHARSGLAHVLLGSVAESVLGAARCDVLVARPVRHSFRLP